MEKNTLYAIVLSTLFIIVWWTFFQPAPQPLMPVQTAVQTTTQKDISSTQPGSPLVKKELYGQNNAAAQAEEEIIVETENYKAVFTTNGAAIKHWYLKEKKAGLIDLVLNSDYNQLSTFPGANYSFTREGSKKLVFYFKSLQGWEVTKTYDLSDKYLHNVKIVTTKLTPSSLLPQIELDWGPGLGTDQKEQKDNLSVTRALGYPVTKPAELNKFKEGEHPSEQLKWVAIDNRYFLAAFIPATPELYNNLTVYRSDKKSPFGISLTSSKPENKNSITYAFNLYLGPKDLSKLKLLKLNLEETIDFGFFGFLGKLALNVLDYLHKVTGNYGWSIILLTVFIQILVLPLALKSFKASAAMKMLQPQIKALQDKFKSDPKRLNVEMLNLYKTQKVNPLGGCLPMILQIPIFWALFSTLRGAYELRGAPWILWITDLSAPDTLFQIGSFPINILPVIMGAGMFFQQKLMAVSTDPMQTKIMYFMPIMFTFMFWGFPSGLVIYWLTNSILTIIEQYFVIHRKQKSALAAK